MNDRTPEDRLENAIRRHLEREEANVDAAAVLTKVKNRLVRPAVHTPWRRALRWGAGVVGIAAAVLFLLWGIPSSTASAESLIQEARNVHAAQVDRLYQIETQYEGNLSKRFPVLAFQRKAQLWTRGDRYTFETSGDNHHWSWGKDEQGRLWVSVGPKAGLVFESAEADEAAFIASDMYSMNFETLLGDLPKGYTLKREAIADRPGFARVTATPKAGHKNAKVREAMLEVEEKTKIVHKLMLKRMIKNDAAVTVTYTLTDTRNLKDSDYQLQGHLDSDAKILGPEKPEMRAKLWKRVLDKRGMLKD